MLCCVLSLGEQLNVPNPGPQTSHITRSPFISPTTWGYKERTVYFEAALGNRPAPPATTSNSNIAFHTIIMAEEEPFFVGFAISVYQNSGDAEGGPSNWGDFEHKRTLLGKPTILNDDKCRESCDFWNLYEEDIERAVAMGSNCFRLSIEWSRIEPQRGQIDDQAVDRYHRIFDCLERCGSKNCGFYCTASPCSSSIVLQEHLPAAAFPMAALLLLGCTLMLVIVCPLPMLPAAKGWCLL